MKAINLTDLFSSGIGKEIYLRFKDTVCKYNMQDSLCGGVLLGLSGGADSVLLLLLLKQLSGENGEFNILAVHVNHLIRGEEAERDEEFSRELCKTLGVEFISRKIDVPAIASAEGKGIEEAARDVRYSTFREILQGRNDISTIAVAHNATDNIETVIFNMMRGSGIAGVCGIAPVRDEIVRPLIEISKKQVLDVMAENELPYVTDNTNSSTDYTRNYIRHEILPLLFRLNDNPERALTRLTSAIREDKEYLDSVAADFLSGRSVNGHIDRAALRELHPSIFSRVLIQMAKGVGCGIEATHISKIKELMDLTSFSYDLPQSCSFVCRNGECYIAPRVQGERVEYSFELKEGINTYPGIRGAIALTKEPLNDSFSNVYKISIQRSFDFDIINGVISARNKKDGDSYFYGGITRKLKKLFNDRSIPPEMRAYIPVICDESGILWVPGFGSREDKSKTSSNKIYISLLSEVENGEIKNENSFRKGTDWTQKS